MTRRKRHVVVVGGGHNGLVCAAYLAEGGYDVTVLERRAQVGGAAFTEEFTPGFRNSALSYSVSLLPDKIIADLDLARHGLKIVDRSSSGFKRFVPVPGTDGLLMPSDTNKAAAVLEGVCAGDGEAYMTFDREVTEIAAVVRKLMMKAPPNLRGGIGDLVSAIMAGNDLRRLPSDIREAFVRLFTTSVGDYLEGRFMGEAVKGMLGYSAATGNFQSPYAPGSAYVLLHHVMGEVNGKQGVWGHAMGGMGAITQAMAAAARARGVTIRTEAPVARVLAHGGRVTGVELEGGEVVEADLVAANVNPKLLFGQLTNEADVPEDFSQAMRNWRCKSGILRINVALSELPNYACRPGSDPAPHHSVSMTTSFSLAHLERAYDEAKHGGWSSEPVIEMNIPSLLDPSLAPDNAHVASLYCQHFSPELSGGRSWDEAKDEAISHALDFMDGIAPNFRRSIVGLKAYTPADLERDFGLIGGDIFHGALHLDQVYSMRPAPGWSNYRMPLKGLYLCGSGAHPGGGVSGIPGHNAARRILSEKRRAA